MKYICTSDIDVYFFGSIALYKKRHNPSITNLPQGQGNGLENVKLFIFQT